MLNTVNLMLTEEPRDGPALLAAAALARRLDAHLDVVALTVEPMPVYAIDGTPVPSEADRATARGRADALAARARSALPDDLRATVEPVMGLGIGLVETVARAARYSDLAVTGRPYGLDHARLAPIIAEALLFGTDVPVLVVPDVDRTAWSRPFRRLCLAWNGGDEAMRAARAALPFLREAAQVDVAVIESALYDSDELNPAARLQLWLSRHGVEAEVTLLARTERRKTDILAHFAADRGCEALVMGAYGHSRLREALLGGTTRDMLAEVPLPLLMAH